MLLALTQNTIPLNARASDYTPKQNANAHPLITIPMRHEPLSPCVMLILEIDEIQQQSILKTTPGLRCKHVEGNAAHQHFRGG